MADATVDAGTPRKSKKGLVLGAGLALLLGGGSFYAVWSGLVLGSGRSDVSAHMPPALEAMPEIAFVPLEPILVSLGPEARASHLRFRGELEVAAADVEGVNQLKPRIIDVLNSYLRAIEPAQFDRPGALIELRAQMLRRIALVVGEDRVRDLLVMEFVLN